uniref:tRNA-splicing endonuclease subunit SEN34 n=1 Tax=Timema genevievae TaxID=629358 RepID=A0A7R9KA76_TIMGE|nr:unnamed protein product [Timema genevievae]
MTPGDRKVPERKRQITDMIDRIVEGKRRKLLGLNTKRRKKYSSTKCETSEDQEKLSATQLQEEESQRKALLEKELSKVQAIDESMYPWLRQEDACTVRWNFPETPGEKLRYNTFKTLWEQGHFITPGQKFGGDFLVYPGDPVKFHAQFLIICVERTSALPMSEIVAFGRLGSSVRKTVVIASTSSDQKSVIFQSINWSGT